MTKRTNPFIAGTLIQQEPRGNRRFDPNAAKELVHEIARNFLGLWERLSALPMVSGPSTLQAQFDRWLYPQVPALAYAYVPIHSYRERK